MIRFLKIKYYQYQMSQCEGDQRHTFISLNNLMGCTLEPVMPTSSSDDELTSRFSTFFFFERITHIRSEIVKLMWLLLIESFL